MKGFMEFSFAQNVVNNLASGTLAFPPGKNVELRISKEKHTTWKCFKAANVSIQIQTNCAQILKRKVTNVLTFGKLLLHDRLNMI